MGEEFRAPRLEIRRSSRQDYAIEEKARMPHADYVAGNKAHRETVGQDRERRDSFLTSFRAGYARHLGLISGEPTPEPASAKAAPRRAPEPKLAAAPKPAPRQVTPPPPPPPPSAARPPIPPAPSPVAKPIAAKPIADKPVAAKPAPVVASPAKSNGTRLAGPRPETKVGDIAIDAKPDRRGTGQVPGTSPTPSGIAPAKDSEIQQARVNTSIQKSIRGMIQSRYYNGSIPEGVRGATIHAEYQVGRDGKISHPTIRIDDRVLSGITSADRKEMIQTIQSSIARQLEAASFQPDSERDPSKRIPIRITL